ncbi:phosphoribosyltransferase-like protein [Ochromonadaceae sp. CCMP2298]|nr:phosphoribosyltransferase-like protein [Ochromonadaceae sp. CCMP2298]
MPGVVEATHPLVAAKMTVLRDTTTSPAEFRRKLKEITFYLGYEATKGLTTKEKAITTPVGPFMGSTVAESVAIIPVLRAGLAMADGLLELMPDASVHHIGERPTQSRRNPTATPLQLRCNSLQDAHYFTNPHSTRPPCPHSSPPPSPTPLGMYRAKESLLPIQYYNRLPRDTQCDVAYVLDPCIATANTINAVVSILKRWGAKRIVVISAVGSRAGVTRLSELHPDIDIFMGAVDEHIDVRRSTCDVTEY